MWRRNLAVPTSLALVLVLTACPMPEEDGELLFTGQHPSCDREPEAEPTSPIHTITVSGDDVSVSPHPLVQNPGPIGLIGWRSTTHHWRVTYPDGSPLPRDMYEGAPRELVLDGVRPNAECRAYGYVVEAWTEPEEGAARRGEGAADTARIRRVYPAEVATDTVNGDEIEPFLVGRTGGR